MRSALLTSIGEDVKPRLNAIAAAARTLRRSEGGDKSLAVIVAAETAQLGRYIDGLVDLSPGDEQEPRNIVLLAIDLHSRIVRRDGKDGPTRQLLSGLFVLAVLTVAFVGYVVR